MSIINLSSQYEAASNDTSYQAGEQDVFLNWLETQFQEGLSMGRKFILLDHAYPGSRYLAKLLWKEDYTRRYFELLRKYHEVIAIEVAGHDHYGDLRYHSSWDVLDFPNTEEEFNFHNIFVSPGLTANKGQQPGFTLMEIDASTYEPKNLKMEFFNLAKTFGFKQV